MRLSRKYPVPGEIALLYEFVNSMDLRRFVEHGHAHETKDELATIPQMERWMRTRRLLKPAARITAGQHREALELRQGLRDFLRTPPRGRIGNKNLAPRLNELGQRYPLVVQIVGGDAVSLQPAGGCSGLARILAELHLLSEGGRLERMKVCSSEECNWVFFDRSKPGTRRWCSATLCGNRYKTRAYRQRQKESTRLGINTAKRSR